MKDRQESSKRQGGKTGGMSIAELKPEDFRPVSREAMGESLRKAAADTKKKPK